MTDTYEGWSNRETWAANLWLANDEGLYRQTTEAAETCLSEEGDDVAVAIARLADEIRVWFEEWTYGEGEDDYAPAPGMHRMLSDIGSLYRIDWREIASGWITTAREEAAR